jgi:hypothetical protein
MTTITQLRSVRSDAVVEVAEQADHHSALYHFFGRLIHITLALYLLPAFLVVLAVGSVGILVLKTYQGLTNLLEG